MSDTAFNLDATEQIAEQAINLEFSPDQVSALESLQYERTSDALLGDLGDNGQSGDSPANSNGSTPTAPSPHFGEKDQPFVDVDRPTKKRDRSNGKASSGKSSSGGKGTKSLTPAEKIAKRAANEDPATVSTQITRFAENFAAEQNKAVETRYANLGTMVKTHMAMTDSGISEICSKLDEVLSAFQTVRNEMQEEKAKMPVETPAEKLGEEHATGFRDGLRLASWIISFARVRKASNSDLNKILKRLTEFDYAEKCHHLSEDKSSVLSAEELVKGCLRML